MSAAASVVLREEEPGRLLLALGGRLGPDDSARAWRDVTARLAAPETVSLAVDASGLHQADAAGLALLDFLRSGRGSPRALVTLSGLSPEIEAALARFPPLAGGSRESPSRRGRFGERTGQVAYALARDAREQVGFLGAVAVSSAAAIRKPRLLRRRELLRILETAGVDAVPMVSLMSFLVGLIIAFEAAQPLAKFGAQIFIADLIGIVMVRELGPIMTAILLAGRSGSAFAAEIGTMRVNEEVNALETMGLDPVRFLVLPRVVAGVVLTPVLTAWSMLTGVLGGVLVMMAMGFPLAAITAEFESAMGVGDVAFGIVKGGVFGLLVALIGCLRGLQTSGGPTAVGESTTRSVVTAILAIIATDAVFSVASYVLNV